MNVSTEISDHGAIEIYVATNGDKSWKCEFTPEDAAELIKILPQAIIDAKRTCRAKLEDYIKLRRQQADDAQKELEALP